MYPYLYYEFTLLVLFVILVFASILFRRYVVFYLNFPNESFLLIVLRWIVMSGIKKNPAASKSILDTLHETCNALQKEGLCVLWIHKPYVMICNEKTMKAFSNEQCAVGKPKDYKILRDFFGISLLTADGDLWKIRRKMLNPAFKTPVLKHHVPMMNESAIALVNQLMKVPNESPVHIIRLLQSCSFANINEFLSGNIAKEPEKRSEMESTIDNMNLLANSFTYRVFRPWLIPTTMWKIFSRGWNYVETLGKFQDFTRNILFEMKGSVVSKKEKYLEKDGFYDAPKSFAQLLVQQHLKNPEFTFKDMHDEVNGLISAETLRLYPAVPVYAKTLEKEVQYEKYTFPKGTDLVFMPYVAHRDPEYYSDPEKFHPERFLEKDSEKKITTYSFAEGPRSCIGKQYALVQVKITLAHLILNFKVTSLARKEDITLHWEMILSTAKPIYFKFSKRPQTKTH